jgi:hypothetical protein
VSAKGKREEKESKAKDNISPKMTQWTSGTVQNCVWDKA